MIWQAVFLVLNYIRNTFTTLQEVVSGASEITEISIHRNNYLKFIEDEEKRRSISVNFIIELHQRVTEENKIKIT